MHAAYQADKVFAYTYFSNKMNIGRKVCLKNSHLKKTDK